MVDAFKSQIDKDINSISDAVSQSDVEEAKVDEKWRISKEESETARKAVEAKCDELKKLIDKKKYTMLQRIDKERLEQEEEVRRRKKEIQDHKAILENFSRYARELKDKGTYNDITTSEGRLHSRTMELKAQHATIMSNKFLWKKIVFREKVWLTEDIQCVGKLDMKEGLLCYQISVTVAISNDNKFIYR